MSFSSSIFGVAFYCAVLCPVVWNRKKGFDKVERNAQRETNLECAAPMSLCFGGCVFPSVIPTKSSFSFPSRKRHCSVTHLHPSDKRNVRCVSVDHDETSAMACQGLCLSCRCLTCVQLMLLTRDWNNKKRRVWNTSHRYAFGSFQ